MLATVVAQFHLADEAFGAHRIVGTASLLLAALWPAAGTGFGLLAGRGLVVRAGEGAARGAAVRGHDGGSRGSRRARPGVRPVSVRRHRRRSRICRPSGWSCHLGCRPPRARTAADRLQGDLLDVTLRNGGIDDGVTLHWHGYDVPCGEDGAPGTTQDAVAPGGEFRYRFRADQTGTFWYHTHQVSQVGVRRGLYGILVVIPRGATSAAVDLTVPVHLRYDGVSLRRGGGHAHGR